MLRPKAVKLFFHCPTLRTETTGYGSSFDSIAIELLRRPELDVSFESGSKPDVQIYYGQPHRGRLERFLQREAETFGIYTMWEASKLPRGWAEVIEDYFDFVIVPSSWCAEIFQENGVSKPMYVVPLGVDPNRFFYMERPERETFSVLWQGISIGDRKGGDLVMQAMEELALPNSRLIVKSHPKLSSFRGTLEIDTPGRKIVHQMITHARLVGLYREADMACYPTRGEGFGLIPLQQMATGLPVAVSQGTGCRAFADPNYALPIKCRTETAYYGAEFGYDEKPLYSSVLQTIEWAYRNREKARDLGRKAAEWVAENWTYRQTVDKLLDVCRKERDRLGRVSAESEQTLSR